MATPNHIRNPFEMAVQQLNFAFLDASHKVAEQARHHAEPGTLAVRRIGAHDLWDALKAGARDLGAVREDVLFIAIIYPLAGLLLTGLALNRDLVPLIFPLASGFALIGPAAAVGLYEISWRREQGKPVTWADALSVQRSPQFGSILVLGLVLVAVFLLWLAAAWTIYELTVRPLEPATNGAFLRDVFTTGQGWTMIIVGCGVGFLFALAAFSISVVSFPLLLEHDVGFGRAIMTSVRAVRANPGPMALWGLIVAGALAVGSAPALFGLIFVMPILGHATWHLYRKVVA
jgi:uncharacterized membrane protein